MGLNDMKMMVMEGQALLESEEGQDGTTSKTHNRELQKALTIVDLADNVREIDDIISKPMRC